MKITFCHDQNISVQGHALHVHRGQTLEIPDADAEALIDGLCAVAEGQPFPGSPVVEEIPAAPKEEQTAPRKRAKAGK